jgi:hypothetical protein
VPFLGEGAAVTLFPLTRLSGCLSRSRPTPSLSCPVSAILGRCGGAPAGSMGGSQPTCERGAASAPKLWHSQSWSASAWQSESTHTRVSLPPPWRETESVEGRLGTPAALAHGEPSVVRVWEEHDPGFPSQGKRFVVRKVSRKRENPRASARARTRRKPSPYTGSLFCSIASA